MNLRDHDKPCEHGETFWHPERPVSGQWDARCPGGAAVTPEPIPWCKTQVHDAPMPDFVDDRLLCLDAEMDLERTGYCHVCVEEDPPRHFTIGAADG